MYRTLHPMMKFIPFPSTHSTLTKTDHAGQYTSHNKLQSKSIQKILYKYSGLKSKIASRKIPKYSQIYVIKPSRKTLSKFSNNVIVRQNLLRINL